MKNVVLRHERSGESVDERFGTQQTSLVADLERLRAERSLCIAMSDRLSDEITAMREGAARAGALCEQARALRAKCRAPYRSVASYHEPGRGSEQLQPVETGHRAFAQDTDTVEALREQRALSGLVDVLASTLDYENTLSRLIELIAEDIGDITVLYVCGADGVAHRVRVANRDPSIAWYCHQIQDIRSDASPEHPVSRAIATRQSLLVEVGTSVLGSLAHSRAHALALSALDLRSIMAVPLLIADRCVGALLLKSVSRVYGPGDLRFARQVAQRTALLIENASLHQTAQQAIQARDEILGIVAHDLRNPLSAILLEASVLAALRGADAQAHVRGSAAVIQDAVRFMKRLIEDLLDAERIRSGRLSLNRSRVSVASTIREFVRGQRPIVTAACLELRVDIADGVSDVHADRDRLLQLLENLVGNAERFTPDGGRITIGARQCADEVLLWVSDTGSGIDAAELPRLFDRFVSPRRIDRPGTGLGLPIVKGIVDAHGGRIWAESAVGDGTTFFFTLPTAIGH